MTEDSSDAALSPVADAFGFIHALPIGICVLDSSFQVVAWNQCLAQWTGVETDEILGESIFAQFPNLEDRGVRLRIQQVFENCVPCVFSPQLHRRILPHKNKNHNQIQSTTVTCWRPHGDDRVFALMAIQDVTDLHDRSEHQRKLRETATAEIENRIRIEETLLHSRERLQAVTDAMPSLIAHCDLNDQFTFVNEAYTKLYGIDQIGFIDSKVQDIHGEEMFDRIRDQIERAKEGHASEFDVELEHPAYGKRTFRKFIRTELCPDGVVCGYYMYSVDITAEKKAEHKLLLYTKELLTAKNLLEEQAEELRKAQMDAESASRSKSYFLANISHEIRTPMTAILGFAEMMAEPDLGEADRNEYMAIIKRNGSHLLALINDILDLSKIESGRLAIELTACSAREIIEEVAQLLRPQCTAQGLELHIVIEPEIPDVIRGDPTRIKQILVNLIGNAIKFTESGSIQIHASHATQTLQVDITDTGIGIEADKIPRLFEMFRQADDSTSRKYGGTGLGLAISRNLAKAMGGEITVTSIPGQGSTFSFTMDTGSVAEPPTESTAGRQIQEKIEIDARVLLAEDAPDSRMLIQTLLRRAGARVDTAENGRIACQKALDSLLDGTPYDLILMDMQMPEVDGLTATRQLRTAGYERPIIALTANSKDEDRSACLEAGCDGFATKPIDRQQLLATVRKFAYQA